MIFHEGAIQSGPDYYSDLTDTPEEVKEEIRQYLKSVGLPYDCNGSHLRSERGTIEEPASKRFFTRVLDAIKF
jgi:hypothetical protein